MMMSCKLAIGAVLIVSASLTPLAVTAEIKGKRDGVGSSQRQTVPPIAGGTGTSQERAKPKTKAKAKPADHCIPKSACKCQWEILDGKQQYVCRVIRATK